MTDTKPTRQPDLNIFAKVVQGDEKKIGPQVGVAFKHSADEGYNIILNVMPFAIDGKVELVGFPPRNDQS